jgi:hypothetical protein
MNPLASSLRTLAAGAVLFLAANDALACACCSDPGDYGLSTIKPEEYHVTQIKSLDFAATARLHMTDAGEDAVKGVTPVLDSYGVVVERDAKGWRFTFRTDDGKTGVLTLPMPTKLTTFAADIHDGATSGGGGPLLYKEWRFEGTALGNGIFVRGPLPCTLIFQGRGNRCDNASDFSHWRLDVQGKQADFAFFGELTSHAK